MAQTCLLIWGWPGSLYSLHNDPNMFTHLRMTWKSLLTTWCLNMFTRMRMTWKSLFTSWWPKRIYWLEDDLDKFSHFWLTWKCLLTSWWPGSVPLPLQSLGQTGGWWRRGECCTARCPEKEHTITVHSIRFTPTHHPHPQRMLEFPWHKLAWIWTHWKKCEFAD